MHRSADHLGQAEIGEEGPFAMVEQDVAWLDVAVDDPSFVGVVQGRGHLGNDGRRLPQVKRLT